MYKMIRLVFFTKFFQLPCCIRESYNLIHFSAEEQLSASERCRVWTTSRFAARTSETAFQLASTLSHFQINFPTVLKILLQYLKTIRWWIMDFFHRRAKQRILSVFVAWCHTHLIGFSLKKKPFQQLSIVLETFLRQVKIMWTKTTEWMIPNQRVLPYKKWRQLS